MTKSIRVFNSSRGFYMSRKQAERAVENHACCWLADGVSVRDLSLAEAIEMRNAAAQRAERLAYAELPGIVYEPAPEAVYGYRNACVLARCANDYAIKAAAR